MLTPRKANSSRRILAGSIAAAVFSAVAVHTAPAAIVFWDGAPGGTADGVSQGGDGTWSTAVANWDNGSVEVGWPGTGNVANFGGTAGTATLGTAIATDGIQVATGGYSIATAGFGLSIGTGGIATTNTTGTTALMGTGTVTLTGAQTWSTAAGGTLATSSTNPVALGANILTLGGAGSSSLAGAVAGTGGITTGGTSTVTLSGTNTYSGPTNVGAGTTLNVNSATALGATAATLTINAATLDNTSGTAVILSNNNAQNWSGDFSFTGGTGTTHDLNLGTGAVTLNAARTVTVNAGTLTSGGTITGATFGITKAGAGTLALNGVIGTTTGGLAVNGGTLIVGNAANTFTGNVTIDGATSILQMTSGSNGTATAGPLGIFTGGTGFKTVTLTNGGTFRPIASYNSNVPTAALPGAGVVFVIGSGGGTFDTPTGVTLTLDDGNTTGTTTAAAELQGSGTLTKIGVGTLSLGNGTSNFSNFTGAILVNAGTLALGNTAINPLGATSAGTTIASGAALDIQNASGTAAEPLTVSGTGVSNGNVIRNSNAASGSFAGPVTLAANSQIGSTAAGNLTLTGGITGTANLTINNTSTGGTIISTTALNNTGTLTNNSSGAGTSTISANIGSNVTNVLQNNAASQLTLSGTNSYTGTSTATTGILSFLTPASIPGFVANPSSVTLSAAAAGTIALGYGGTGQFTATDINNVISGAFPITFTAGGLLGIDTTNATGGVATLSNNLTDFTGGPSTGIALGINKVGTGKLIVTGTNSETGAMMVSAGTLTLSGPNALPANVPLTLKGGTLAGAQSGTLEVLTDAVNPVLNNPVNLNGTSTFTVGNNGGATTGSTVTFGALSAPATATNVVTTTTFTGNNGYTFSFPSLALPGGTGNTTNLIANTNVVVTGNVSNRGTGAPGNFDTIALQGTATGNAINGVIADAATGSLALGNYTPVTKSGTGTWTLSGANTYTGATTVSAGTLVLQGSAGAGTQVVGNSQVLINGGTLKVASNVTIGTGAANGNGTAASTVNQGTVSVGTTAAGTLSLQDNAINTLTIQGSNFTGTANTLIVGGATTAGTISLDLGNDVADQIVLNASIAGSGKASVAAGGAILNLNQLSGTSLTTGTPVNLISYNNGAPVSGFTIGTQNPGAGQVYVLNPTAAALQLVAGNAAAANSDAYFTGAAGSLWNTISGSNAANFATTRAGTTAAGFPGSTTNVYLAADNATAANLATTLGQTFTINSLNFTGTGTPTAATAAGVAGINTLTLAAANGYTDSQGTPVTYPAGTGLVIQNGVTATDTISAPLALGNTQTWLNGGQGTLAITGGVTGTGNLTLKNNSTGVTTISGGSLNNVGTFTNSGTGAGLTTVSSVIGTNVSGVVQNSATSNLTLSGTNTFTGGLTINAGLVNFTVDANLGGATSPINLNGGTLNSTGTAAAFSLATGRVINVGLNGGTLATAGTGTTGKISITGSQLLGSGTFTHTGASDLQITGASTFSGQFNVSGLVEASTTGALGTGPVFVNTNGELSINTASVLANAFTFNGGTISPIGGAVTIPATTAISAAGNTTLALRAFNTTTTSNSLVLAAPISGSGNLTLTGTTGTANTRGVLTLSGNNSGWTGAITTSGFTAVNGGTIRLGSTSALGSTSTGTTLTAGASLDLNGINYASAEPLSVTGPGPTSFPTSITNENTTTVASFAGPITLGSSISIGSSTGANFTLSGDISGTGFGITKGFSAAQVVTLSSANSSYTGPTLIQNGTLSVTTLANGGTNSSIGASSNAAANLVFGATAPTNGGLQYTGGTATSDRAFTITAGTTATIDVTQAATKLSLAGATGAATTGALTKIGTGTLTLAGSNTYTGATTVNAGTLALGPSGNLAATAVTVGAGALTVAQTVDASTNSLGSSLTMNTGSALNLADGFTTTLNVAGAANLLATAGSSNYTFDVSGTNGVSDKLAIGGIASASQAGAKVNVNLLSPATVGNSYVLISGGASSTLTTNGPTLTNSRTVLGNNAYGLTLTNTATASTLTISTADFAAVYYNGTQGTAALNATGISAPGLTNFSTDLSGATNTQSQPTFLADVFFTANSVSAATPVTIASLGQDYTWNSLNFTANSPAVTINNGGANTLGLIAGINVVTGSPAQTVNVPLTLSAAQTFTNNSTNPLTVSGAIATGGNTLTVAGSGPTTLSNTISGTGVITMLGSGTLTLSGSSTIKSLNLNNASGIVDIGSGTLTFNNAGSDFIRSTTGGTINATGGGTIVLGSGTNPNFGDNGTLAGTTLTINAPISGANGFEVYGGSVTAGTVVLTAANTFTGDVNVDGGILSVSNIGNAGSTTSNLGAGTNVFLSGGGTNALKYTGTGESTNRVLTLNGTTTAGAIDQSGPSGNLNFTANLNASGGGIKTLTLQGSTAGTGEISGIISNNSAANTTAITKAGTGTWTLSGANTYSGGTTILGGNLVAKNAAALGAATGNLTFGNSTNTVLSPSTGNLDLSSFGSTVGLLKVVSNSATANGITIGSGQTLTATGGLTIGLDVATAAGAASSALALNGAGNFAITGGSVQVGVSQSVVNAANSSTGVLDLSGLAGSFSATGLTNFNVGQGNDSGGTVILGNGGNTIAATTLAVSDSTGNNAGPTASSLTLGTGTNALMADTINIGLSKAVGSLGFASQATGSPGSITITNKAGTGSAAINVGANGTTPTSAGAIGTLDLRGHNATVNASTLTIATSAATSNVSTATGTVSFDSGTFTVDTVTMATRSGGATGTSTGTLNIGGGAFTVNTAFTLGSQANAGAANATLNLTGGTLTSNTDLLSGTTSATSTIVLNGGTLNMTNHNIGSSTVAIDNVTLQSGTLRNVAQINNGAGLTKSSDGTLAGGTLNLAGTNAYTGATTVNAGTVIVQGSLTGTTSVAVSNGAALLLAGSAVSGGNSNVVNSSASAGLGGSGTLGFIGNSVDNTPSSAANPASQTFTTLTLGGTPTVDFGIGSNATFTFGSLAASNFTALTVNHWSGQFYSLGSTTDNGLNTDRFLFNTDPGFTPAQLASISFFGDNGAPLGIGAMQVSYNNGTSTQFEIVPVPEPSTMSIVAAGLGLLGLRRQRRSKRSV